MSVVGAAYALGWPAIFLKIGHECQKVGLILLTYASLVIRHFMVIDACRRLLHMQYRFFVFLNNYYVCKQNIMNPRYYSFLSQLMIIEIPRQRKFQIVFIPFPIIFYLFVCLPLWSLWVFVWMFKHNFCYIFVSYEPSEIWIMFLARFDVRYLSILIMIHCKMFY